MQETPDPQVRPKKDQQGLRFFAITSFVGVVAAFVFVGFPQIDFAVTDWFYQGNRAFVSNFPGTGQDLRALMRLLFLAAVATAIIGLVLAAFFQRKLLEMGLRQWLFLISCLALGPGLVTNVILKNNWGRARPFHVREYGGDQTFTPALFRSDQCVDNCSFVSGEASSIFMLFFALALLLSRHRASLVAAAIIGGTLAGFVRIAQGGHFLSDVVFAGVVMALVAQGLYWLIFNLAGERLSDDSPLQTRLTEAGKVASASSTKAARTAEEYAREKFGPSIAKGVDRVKQLRGGKSELPPDDQSTDGDGQDKPPSDGEEPGGKADGP
jgi:lipid A 4'-phosphatase